MNEAVTLAKNPVTSLTTGNGADFNFKELVLKLKEGGKLQNEVPLTGEYWEPEEGEINIMGYVGKTSFTGKEDNPIDAVRLVNNKGKSFVTAAAIIVSTC